MRILPDTYLLDDSAGSVELGNRVAALIGHPSISAGIELCVLRLGATGRKSSDHRAVGSNRGHVVARGILHPGSCAVFAAIDLESVRAGADRDRVQDLAARTQLGDIVAVPVSDPDVIGHIIPIPSG